MLRCVKHSLYANATSFIDYLKLHVHEINAVEKHEFYSLHCRSTVFPTIESTLEKSHEL